MATATINLTHSAIGSLTNISSNASTDYHQTGSVSNNGGTLQIYIPINVLTATGFPASCINNIQFKYSISQERYGFLSSAGTVSTGYKNSDGSYQQSVNHANGIGKGVDNYNSYTDTITPYFSGNVATLGMKITNVINAQDCYYRIKNVSFVIDYTPKYTVTWKNWDGTTLETDTGVVSGTTPTYNGSTPTRASTAQYTYTFSGWSPSVGAITGNTTYTAQFTANLRSYTISAVASSNEMGTVTGGGTYNYGSTPTLTATPATGYKFVRWSDGVTTASRTVTVTGAATYTAVFEKDTINKLQIGTSYVKGVYYNTSTKIITFIIDEAVSITPSGADTLDGYHLAVSNTVPSGAVEIKCVQVGKTYVYKK